MFESVRFIEMMAKSTRIFFFYDGKRVILLLLIGLELPVKLGHERLLLALYPPQFPCRLGIDSLPLRQWPYHVRLRAVTHCVEGHHAERGLVRVSQLLLENVRLQVCQLDLHLLCLREVDVCCQSPHILLLLRETEQRIVPFH